MGEDVYQKLCETMARRGGLYPGMDIPEFYELVQELFTPEEAAVCNAQPRGFSPEVFNVPPPAVNGGAWELPAG